MSTAPTEHEIDEMVEDIYENTDGTYLFSGREYELRHIREVVEHLSDEGKLAPKPPEQIDPKDIRKGDRIRREKNKVGSDRRSTVEYTARFDGQAESSDHGSWTFYLIDRPELVLPQAEGARVKVRNRFNTSIQDAVRVGGKWHIATTYATLLYPKTDEYLLEGYELIEVKSDGL